MEVKFQRGILVSGMAFALANHAFLPDRPYKACLICGAVFQSELDRLITTESSVDQIFIAKEVRDTWATKHAKLHSQHQHQMLYLSGLLCTPEAAKRLVAFGLIPLDGNGETEAALLESSPIPSEEAES